MTPTLLVAYLIGCTVYDLICYYCCIITGQLTRSVGAD